MILVQDGVGGRSSGLGRCAISGTVHDRRHGGTASCYRDRSRQIAWTSRCRRTCARPRLSVCGIFSAASTGQMAGRRRPLSVAHLIAGKGDNATILHLFHDRRGLDRAGARQRLEPFSDAYVANFVPALRTEDLVRDLRDFGRVLHGGMATALLEKRDAEEVSAGGPAKLICSQR